MSDSADQPAVTPPSAMRLRGRVWRGALRARVRHGHRAGAGQFAGRSRRARRCLARRLRARALLLLVVIPAALAGEAGPSPAPPLIIDCGGCPEMVVVPAGEFTMGATAEELVAAALPAHFAGREEPRHRVRIARSFAVSRYEISRAQFAHFVEAAGYAPEPGCWIFIGSEFVFQQERSWRDPGFAQEDDHPVTCISWHDAVAYASWLSAVSGARYRLLSEAEWEYMARGGTDTPWWFGDSPQRICDFVNLGDISTRERFRWHEKELKYAPLDNWRNAPCDDGHAATAAVTFGQPNPFGIYNVLGNVQELVADCWLPSYASGPVSEAPRQSSGDCGYRVMRGQGWSGIESSARSAFRARMLATDRRFYLGIRLARDVDPNAPARGS